MNFNLFQFFPNESMYIYTYRKVIQMDFWIGEEQKI